MDLKKIFKIYLKIFQYSCYIKMTHKKVRFAEYDEVYYIPKKNNKEKYLLTSIENKQKPILKKRKINIFNNIYNNTVKYIGRFKITFLN